MKLSKNFSWIAIILVAAVLAIIAGQAYWLQNKSKYIQSANRIHGFQLLDENNNLFDSKRIPKGQKTLFLFTPDQPLVKHVAPAREMLRELRNSSVGKKITTILVSRMHKDAAMNLKLGLEMEGTLLLDPAANVGSMYEFWTVAGHAKNWCYAFVDDMLRPYFTVCTSAPAPWKEIRPYLEAEYPSEESAATTSSRADPSRAQP